MVKKKLSRPTVVLLVLIWLAFICFSIAVIDGRQISLQIIGKQTQTISYGEDYIDPGARIITNGKLFGEIQIGERIFSKTPIDTSSVGQYSIDYTTNILGRTYTAHRTVDVVDNVAPDLVLTNGGGICSANWYIGFAEPGFAAYDDYDGDLTEQVQTAITGNQVTYTVSDSSGNETSAVRYLTGSMDPPIIELIDGNEITIAQSVDFQDPGYSCTDNHGNDYSEFIEVAGTVNPKEVGDYRLVYSLVNTAGEVATAERIVHIVPASEGVPVQKIMYLTFDDGPGPYTDKLLDILDQYNVKATFFVTCHQPEYREAIKRAYDEGHSIGVHSATHNYARIYASVDAFLADFTECQDMVYEITGSYTNLMRFPAGSSNVVSRDYSTGIMSRLVREMTDLGYSYFDWNVDSNDARGASSSNEVYTNVTSACSRLNVCVVLQHDVKGFSVDAVEGIIQWGIDNGYRFCRLTESSFGAHHGTNN